MTKIRSPHTLLSVTQPIDNDDTVVRIRCWCLRWEMQGLKADAESAYEAHVVAMGATLGKVPWRKEPE